jgi:hypothetical protein
VAEAPAGGVVHARRLLRTVVGPEQDVLATGRKLRHPGGVRVPADAAKPVDPIGWLRRREGMASAVELQAARPKRSGRTRGGSDGGRFNVEVGCACEDEDSTYAATRGIYAARESEILMRAGENIARVFFQTSGKAAFRTPCMMNWPFFPRRAKESDASNTSISHLY